jgi:hypothetical protein
LPVNRNGCYEGSISLDALFDRRSNVEALKRRGVYSGEKK